MTDTPFNPSYGTGQTVTAGASASAAISGSDRQVCITNTGAAVAYVRCVAGNASAADYPIMPGAQVVITKGDQAAIQHFCASSTTLHIMTGNGW
jgi:hypothetical protein